MSYAVDFRRHVSHCPYALSIIIAFLALVSLSAPCRAQAVALEPAEPTLNTVLAPSPVTTVPGSMAAEASSATVPTNYAECLALLKGTDRINPALVEAVAQLLSHPENASGTVPQRPPSLLAVTWRETAGQVHDPVVQAYYNPIDGGDVSPPNIDGYIRERLGGEFTNSADYFLGLRYQQVVYFGSKDQVARQQRVLGAALNGDMTLLRQQTIDPLRLLAVMPQGGTLLPSSLRSRVRGLVLNATLEYGTWRGQVGMVTADGETAEQVAMIVSAWRDMAMSLAETFASHNSGKELHQALEASTVQVVNNRVLASAALDSSTILRATKEIAGHGNGCPPGGACPSDSVALCHKQSGRPDQTLCVPPSDVAAHLAAGDTCGPCAQ
jgi:hypothetical protein